MEDKIWLGAHTSAAGGSYNALYEGQKIGASTIQLFTSNQKQWQGRLITKEEVLLWEKALAETGIDQVMSHDSYLINLGSPHPEMLQKSKNAFRQELERCHLLKIPYLNFHPGAYTTGNVDECLETIAQSLMEFEHPATQGQTRLLLEMTAGQGTSVGFRFEHVAYIIQKAKKKVPLGVCIDTCHIFAAGYDIRTAADCEKMLDEFDALIGLEHLYAMHLNDSQKECGSRVDRHAPLGEGKIGAQAFEFFMSSPRTRHLPKYLETPGGPENWKKEIALLKTYPGKS